MITAVVKRDVFVTVKPGHRHNKVQLTNAPGGSINRIDLQYIHHTPTSPWLQRLSQLRVFGQKKPSQAGVFLS
jgi:hypothetical protein